MEIVKRIISAIVMLGIAGSFLLWVPALFFIIPILGLMFISSHEFKKMGLTGRQPLEKLDVAKLAVRIVIAIAICICFLLSLTLIGVYYGGEDSSFFTSWMPNILTVYLFIYLSCLFTALAVCQTVWKDGYKVPVITIISSVAFFPLTPLFLVFFFDSDRIAVIIIFAFYGTFKILIAAALVWLLIVFVRPLHNKKPAFWLTLGFAWLLMPLFLWFWWGMASFYGNYELLWLIGVVAIGDSAAWFGGKLLGKHKLAPKISPGKTWEGAVCSLLAALAMGFYLAHILPLASQMFDFSLAGLFAIILCINILAQVGDLFESKIKRHFNVKNSGTLIPGHGGVLDRLDGYFLATLFMSMFML